MKRIFSLIFCFVLSLSCMASAYAADSVNILLNGEKFESDTEPFIEQNRTMVPVRAIFEAMGAQVRWDEENKTVLMVRQKDDVFTSVVLQIGLDKAFVNSESVALDAPAKIVGNRTYVPLRFIIEAFDENITWDDASRTVSIVTK